MTRRPRKPRALKPRKVRAKKPHKTAVHHVRAQRAKVAKMGTPQRSKGVKKVVTRTR